MKDTGKTVFIVTLITLLTKVLVVVGNLLGVAIFGSDNVYYDIYNYSNTTQQTIFTIIGTSLTTIVIPIYSSLIQEKDSKKSDEFLNDIISISTLLICIVVAVWFFIIPLYLKTMTGYGEIQEEFNYAVAALRAMMFVMFFTGLNFILQGVLQSNNKFRLVAAVSLPSSLVIIFYNLFLANRFGVTGLIVATIIGLALQPIMLMPAVSKLGYKYKFSLNFKNPNIIKSGKLTLAVLVGVSAHQINMMYNANLSTRFEAGTATILALVQNIILQTVLLLIYSITAIYYPRLSLFWSGNKIDEYKDSLKDVINMIVFFLLPASIGFILMRFDIINILRWSNKFNDESAIVASNMLGVYGIGVLFIGLKEVFDRALYAQSVTLPSGIVGFLIMFTNIIISLLTKDIIGPYSMPLGYSISSMVGTVCLLIVIYKKVGKLSKDVYINILKCLISAGIMGIAVSLMKKFIYSISINSVFISRLLNLFFPTMIGVLVYFALTYILGVSNSRALIDSFTARFTKKGGKN